VEVKPRSLVGDTTTDSKERYIHCIKWGFAWEKTKQSPALSRVKKRTDQGRSEVSKARAKKGLMRISVGINSRAGIRSRPIERKKRIKGFLLAQGGTMKEAE